MGAGAKHQSGARRCVIKIALFDQKAPFSGCKADRFIGYGLYSGIAVFPTTPINNLFPGCQACWTHTLPRPRQKQVQGFPSWSAIDLQRSVARPLGHGGEETSPIRVGKELKPRPKFKDHPFHQPPIRHSKQDWGSKVDLTLRGRLR